MTIRGEAENCSDGIDNTFIGRYAINNTSFGLPPPPLWPAYNISVNWLNGWGVLPSGGLAPYFDVVIGSDIAPMGMTGPCCTGPTGSTGPTGAPALDAIVVASVWRGNGVTPAPDPMGAFLSPGEFQTYNAPSIAGAEYDVTNITGILISVYSTCAPYVIVGGSAVAEFDVSNSLVNRELVIRGYSTHVGAVVCDPNTFNVRGRYLITANNTPVNANTAWLDISFVSGFGMIRPPPAADDYYKIVIGTDIVDPGPTGPAFIGPTGATGPTGPTGARGRPCIVVSSTWEAPPSGLLPRIRVLAAGGCVCA